MTKDGYVVVEKVMTIPETAVQSGRPCAETDETWLAQYAQMKSRLRKLTNER